jgi:hypothetical protein
MLSTGCFESLCRHPEKLCCIKDVACVLGEVNGYEVTPSMALTVLPLFFGSLLRFQTDLIATR